MKIRVRTHLRGMRSGAASTVSPVHVLVTGGAGFIGSNLVDGLLADGHEVRVLDDLCTGYRDNLDPAAELATGSVSDPGAVEKAVAGVDAVFHLAAHRSVFRSVEAPLETDTANTHGTLTILKAALDAGVQRVVYSSSSSVYGGADLRPTPESAELMPRSPYAVTKLAGEHYCRVFTELYGLETVALRYFNVYGPRQRADSMYAAVIPIFINALHEGRAPEVHGDGEQTRDFTFVSDAVAANIAALHAPTTRTNGKAYNIAGGKEHSLLDLLAALKRIIGTDIEPTFTDARPGDVRHSRADVKRAADDLGWQATVDLSTGLSATVDWLAAHS